MPEPANFVSHCATESLILDLLEWLTTRERTYEEVMAAWRTSCPRLPVWEEANDRGLVASCEVQGRSIVKSTPSGLAAIARRLVREESSQPR